MPCDLTCATLLCTCKRLGPVLHPTHTWPLVLSSHAERNCLIQVGASNELPESEELDALYDRFLLRRRVAQVTPGALSDMLQGAAELSSSSGGVAAPAAAAATIQDVALPRETFRAVRCVDSGGPWAVFEYLQVAHVGLKAENDRAWKGASTKA